MKPELRLEQKQIVTPQLLLNLKILALPNLELETLIRTEIEQNPALELASDSTEPAEKESETPLENEPEPITETANEELDLSEYINDDSFAYTAETEIGHEIIENTSPARANLETNLLNLIRPYLAETDHEIAEYIIGNLDNEGFLSITEEEIAHKFLTPITDIREILDIIRDIEPGGIAAVNLKQALLIQLQKMNYSNESNEVRIVREFYDLFLKRDHAQIIKELKISSNDLAHALLNLKNLEPRPIRQYLPDTAVYINPDFSIIWQNEKLTTLINDELFPVLKISKRYREILRHPKNFSPEEVNFARGKLQNAVNLLKAIESRKKLLVRIINYIIDNQYEFLINGKEYIKPLPIKNIAETLGVHISTISRACQGKYVETPVGIYPLKYFFTTGIGEFSRHSLKEKIQNLIAQENKSKPYTDDMIVNKLAQQNIKLSRRTVAKYREELNIVNSAERVQK